MDGQWAHKDGQRTHKDGQWVKPSSCWTTPRMPFLSRSDSVAVNITVAPTWVQTHICRNKKNTATLQNSLRTVRVIRVMRFHPVGPRPSACVYWHEVFEDVPQIWHSREIPGSLFLHGYSWLGLQELGIPWRCTAHLSCRTSSKINSKKSILLQGFIRGVPAAE